MRLYRQFVGYVIAFPFEDTVAEGTLRAVDRTGRMYVTNVIVMERNTQIDLGEMVLDVPAWVRRINNG